MKIEITYQQTVLAVNVQPGTTAQTAIEASNILSQYPDIDLTQNAIGVFSKKITLDTVLNPGDRVEIYRPLLIDPKEARRLRAKKAKLKSS